MPSCILAHYKTKLLFQHSIWLLQLCDQLYYAKFMNAVGVQLNKLTSLPHHVLQALYMFSELAWEEQSHDCSNFLYNNVSALTVSFHLLWLCICFVIFMQNFCSGAVHSSNMLIMLMRYLRSLKPCMDNFRVDSLVCS